MHHGGFADTVKDEITNNSDFEFFNNRGVSTKSWHPWSAGLLNDVTECGASYQRCPGMSIRVSGLDNALPLPTIMPHEQHGL